MSQLTAEYGGLAKYAAYLGGHLAGLGRNLAAAAPMAQKLIEENGYFSPLFQTLTERLESMWRTRESWAGLNAYDPLTKFARELLRAGGIELSMRGGQLYVDVPFTEETMP